jgi:hypothetical protein
VRLLAPTVVMLAAMTPALAHGPLDGEWAMDLADCAPSETPTDIVPMLIDGTVIDFYESRCMLTDVEEVGWMGTMWRSKMSCVGEGEEWDAGEMIFALEGIVDGVARRLVQVDLTSGHVTVHENCNVPAE